MEDKRPIKDTLREGLEEARESARQTGPPLAEEAARRADAGLGAISRETTLLARALQRASEQAERDGARAVQVPLRRMAAFCQDLAARTDGKSTEQLLAELQDFGRRQPAGLFAAAAAAGFLGTRVARVGTDASSSESRSAEAGDTSDTPESAPGSGLEPQQEPARFEGRTP